MQSGALRFAGTAQVMFRFFIGSGASSLVTFIPYAGYHLKIGK